MLYNIQENVKIVISVLKAYNIRHIVVSPGGTNIPISIAVQNDDFFKCYSVPDERSAMYFAIGLGFSGEPSLTCPTEDSLCPTSFTHLYKKPFWSMT